MSDVSVSEVNITYSKSKLYRTVPVNGVWGGPTPQNMLHVGFFYENHPFPLSATLSVENNVAVGPEKTISSENGIQRTIDVAILMDLNTTLCVYVWLEGQLRHLATNAGITPEQLNETLQRQRGNGNVSNS